MGSAVDQGQKGGESFGVTWCSGGNRQPVSPNSQVEDPLKDFETFSAIEKKEAFNKARIKAEAMLLALEVSGICNYIKGSIKKLVGIQADLQEYVNYMREVRHVTRDPFIKAFSGFVRNIIEEKGDERGSCEGEEKLTLDADYLNNVFKVIEDGEEVIVAQELWDTVYGVKNDLVQVLDELPDQGHIQKYPIIKKFSNLIEGLGYYLEKLANKKEE